MIKYVYALISVFIVTSALNAQVTIGSGLKPSPGTILDLKEKESSIVDNSNSVRGLLLPRVNLVSRTALYPMLAPADTVSKDKNLDYAGLVVYNTNNCLRRNGDDNGVYTWDGSKWQPAGAKNQNQNVRIYTDQDGNPFTAANFGTAGIWMTQNLMARKYDTNITTPPLFPASPAIVSNNLPQWCYPEPNNTVAPIGENANYLKTQPALGLLYNWYAASGKLNNTVVNQGQVDASGVVGVNEVESLYENIPGAKNGKIQGICPNGWHIPSDREWNNLEREIYNQATQYSIFTASNTDADGYPFATAWNPLWEFGYDSGAQGFASDGVGFRPAGTLRHGTAMVSQCDPIVSSDKTPGKSLSSIKGGFNTLLTGFVDTQNAPLGLKSVGKYSYIWSSSRMPSGVETNINESVLRRTFAGQPNEGGVYRRTYSPQAAYFSVRCKKDDNDFTIVKPNYQMDCSTVTVNSTYAVGVSLSAANTVTFNIYADPAYAGAAYSFNTNTLNGITFAASGTIQAGGGIQKITLLGSGTPTVGGVYALTLKSNNSQTANNCVVKVTVVPPIPKMRGLFVGGNNPTYFYNFNGGATLDLITKPATFSIDASSKVKSEGIDRVTSGQGDQSIITDAVLESYLNGATPVDFLVVSYNNTSIGNTAAQVASVKKYLANGGSVLIYQDGSLGAAYAQSFLRGVLNNATLTVQAFGGGGNVFAFTTANTEVLNGPFGDLRGLQWGEDASASLIAKGIPASEITILSTDTDISTNTAGTASPTAFVHNTLNLIWVGDGGFNSAAPDPSPILSPFRANADGTPAVKTGYGRGANKYSIYNSYFTANAIAWMLKKAQQNKAK